MLWFSAEKQPSIFIEFFNSIGTSESFMHHIAKDRSWLRFQPVDATHWLNRSAGVSKFNVSRGLSLRRLATAFNLFW